MTRFAEVADLQDVTGKTYNPTQVRQLESLLDMVSDHLRDIIGSHVYPRVTSTITLHAHAGDGYVDIPVKPLISIDSMKVDGHVRTPRRVDDSVQVCGPAEVELTITHGYATVPGALKSYAIVLASQAFKGLEELGTLGSGEVSSISIDDYQKAFKSGEDLGPFGMPDRVIARLRAKYGAGDVTVVRTR